MYVKNYVKMYVRKIRKNVRKKIRIFYIIKMGIDSVFNNHVQHYVD